MRTGKKLLALLLALSMALSLTVTAFAEDESAAGSEAAPAEETTETAGEETAAAVKPRPPAGSLYCTPTTSIPTSPRI